MIPTLGTGTSVPLGVASRDAKQIGFTRIASRDAKTFSRVPLKLGVSFFLAATGSARFSRRATRATNFKGLEKRFRVARRLIVFFAQGYAKNVFRVARRNSSEPNFFRVARRDP